jgi:CheY-like chemotaxis protein
VSGTGQAATEDTALILVVDDTHAKRYIASSWLRRRGHQVIEAGTGAEALAAMRRWPVDLVLLDVGLPDMSGYEVCERIKADPETARPVVHLSATAIRGVDRAQGLTRGADAYLTEPVEPDELLATVDAVLRNYRARTTAETRLVAAESLADRLATQYAEEHALALTLQRSFLPDLSPEVAGLELAARYLPSTRNAEIGGDFYECVEVDDSRLLVAIGDVAGHSIHAATVMVELRHALRAYAVDGHRPDEILQRLEWVLARYHPGEFATLCVLLLDRTTGELLVANAGHLPPLLVGPASADFLAVHGTMLGVGMPPSPARPVRLPESWSLVLITDGLIEGPGVDIDQALDRLRGMATLDQPPAALCDRLIAEFEPDGRDDVAMLVLRRGS